MATPTRSRAFYRICIRIRIQTRAVSESLVALSRARRRSSSKHEQAGDYPTATRESDGESPIRRRRCENISRRLVDVSTVPM